MVAVGSDRLIARPHGGQKTSGDRFLAAVDVEVTADLALAEGSLRRFLEEAHRRHLTIEIQESLAVSGYRLMRYGRLLGRRSGVRCRRLPLLGLPLGGRHALAPRGQSGRRMTLALARCSSAGNGDGPIAPSSA